MLSAGLGPSRMGAHLHSGCRERGAPPPCSALPVSSRWAEGSRRAVSERSGKARAWASVLVDPQGCFSRQLAIVSFSSVKCSPSHRGSTAACLHPRLLQSRIPPMSSAAQRPPPGASSRWASAALSGYSWSSCQEHQPLGPCPRVTRSGAGRAEAACREMSLAWKGTALQARRVLSLRRAA